MSFACLPAALRSFALSLSLRIPRRRRSLLTMQLAAVAAADRLAFVIGVFMSGQDGSPLPPPVSTGGPIGPPLDITCSPGCSESAVVASPVWPSDPAASGVAVDEPDPCSPPPQPQASDSSASIPTSSMDDLTDCTTYPL